MDFHKRLRTLRKDKELSYLKIAEACGVAWQTVQQWCQEDGPYPKMEHMEPLARFLGTTPWYLLWGVEHVGNAPNNEGKQPLSDEAEELIQCVIQLDSLGHLPRDFFILHTQLLGLEGRLVMPDDSFAGHDLPTSDLIEHIEAEAGSVIESRDRLTGGQHAGEKRRRSGPGRVPATATLVGGRKTAK